MGIVVEKILYRLKVIFFAKIDKAFYRDLIVNYIFGLIFFSILIMLNQLFVLVRLYFEFNVPLSQVFLLLLNIIPFLLSFSIPFAILPAYLLTMGRISGDSEAIAMSSCGISTFRIFLPGLIFALVISLFAFWFKDSVEMPANLNYLRLQAKIMSQRPVVELKQQGFREIGGYKISFGGNFFEGNVEILTNIHLIDIDGRRTIEAEKGRFFSDPEDPEHYVLKFMNGSISEVMKDRDERGVEQEKLLISSFRYLSLNRYVALPREVYTKSPDSMSAKELQDDIDTQTKPMQKKILELESNKTRVLKSIESEKSQLEKSVSGATADQIGNRKTVFDQKIKELQNSLKDIEVNLRNYRDSTPRLYTMKLYEKYTMPFSAFIFALLCLPLGLFTARSGRGEGLGISIVIMLSFFGITIGTENLITQKALPTLAIFLPDLLFLIVGVTLFIKKVRV